MMNGITQEYSIEKWGSETPQTQDPPPVEDSPLPPNLGDFGKLQSNLISFLQFVDLDAIVALSSTSKDFQRLILTTSQIWSNIGTKLGIQLGTFRSVAERVFHLSDDQEHMGFLEKAKQPSYISLERAREFQQCLNALDVINFYTTAMGLLFPNLRSSQGLRNSAHYYTILMERCPITQTLLARFTYMNFAHKIFHSLIPSIRLFPHLVRLDMEGNHLTSLPIELAQLTSLHSLDLTKNHFCTIPPVLVQMNSLQRISLRENLIASLPPVDCFPPSLTGLDLAKNALTCLPPHIGQLTRLESLFLCSNNLPDVPIEMERLKKLKTLNIAKNKLFNIPASIFKITTLAQLRLSKNFIREVPEGIGGLTSLRILCLDRNNLAQISPAIGKLSTLVGITIAGNALTTLPKEIVDLSGLREIKYENNPFQSLPQEVMEFIGLKPRSLSRKNSSSFSESKRQKIDPPKDFQ